MKSFRFVLAGIAWMLALTYGVHAQVEAPALRMAPGDGQVRLEWAGADDPNLSHYELYRSVYNGYIRLDRGTTSFVDDGLDNGTTYYYALVSVDQDGVKKELAGRTAATPIDLYPAAPAGFSASGRDREALLSWRPNQEYDFQQYLLYRNTDGEAPTRTDAPLATFGADDTSYVDAGLANETMYHYFLTAIDGARNRSDLSNATAVPGFVPEGLMARSGDQLVHLTWDANTEPGLSHYVLYRTEDYKRVPAAEDSVARIEMGDSLFVDTGLSYGQTYYYYLAIVDDRNYSNIFVQPVTATPQNLAPIAPSGLTVSVEVRAAQLDWTSNPEADVSRYFLYRTGSSDGSIETEVPIAQVDRTQTTYSDPGLNAGTTYYYFLIAEDMSGNQSVRSPQVSATVPKPRYQARDLTYFLLAAQFFLIPLAIAF
mgnify:CR=1 FL=1